ncbi:MAG: hypothetical protein GXP36_08180 [Actinobacteria bacterium]|nr:hypothetical protein [Actinomycetota bacterium]
MPANRDPFDILRVHDPVDFTTLPNADSASAQALFEAITNSPRPDRSRVRRRRRIIALAVLAALLAAATWVALTRDITAVGVACYGTTDLDADRVGIAPAVAPTVDLCVAPWEEGPLTNPDVARGQVPPLTGCVTAEGILAVLPTDDPTICESLGLATPNPSQQPDRLDSIAQTEAEIVDYIAGEECVAPDEAEVRVRSILDDNGLKDWTITRQPTRTDRPCTSIAFDTAAKTVILVPHPLRP